ncbi:hypothetical protein ID858_10495 [Xenorhabdus sp. DI]|uniref:hypothetical protein n=1 Tax=Xenorhabdus doucetiae TaxID=351671 RepID=UPI0019BFDA70|nr:MULTISPECIES: hypothetical protein [unclassified Xenorhabdus]MBD2784710.1 hypothetical protein [Xenorhabdus sp. 3]MBD2788934.1 hypothetical protein [Xenorhabdus sp. DI]MBD2795809.1 hypothetical protein [Xenorhabdus sp. 18]
MKITDDVYIKFHGFDGIIHKSKISGYRFDGDIHYRTFKSRSIPENSIRIFLCKCGADDWSNDGRSINEYCCESCMEYVAVY